MEWTLGNSGDRDALNLNTGERVKPRFYHLVPALHQRGDDVYQFSFQWAIERTVTDRLQVFLHGYFDGTMLLWQGNGKVIVVGA